MLWISPAGYARKKLAVDFRLALAHFALLDAALKMTGLMQHFVDQKYWRARR